MQGHSTAVGHGPDERQRGGLVTDTIAEHAARDLKAGTPLVEMEGVGKAYGAIRALEGINLTVNAGEVACVLGDNGAGKSTLIKIISGLHGHSEGTLRVDGQERKFSSPRESLDAGIATVYQDLAVVGLMEVWRNFFLGSEIRKGKYPMAPLDIKAMREVADAELQKMGIVVKDINQPIGTLSGRAAAVRRHRPGGLLRRPRADPRRADRGAGASSSPAWC
jgi:simple sugar transport system ATP-binding protein